MPPFPSSAARWCTSDFKRGPINKWLRNNIGTEGAVCTMGLRREESTARAKKTACAPRKQASAPTKGRQVVDWNPILDYTLADVWRVIGYSLDELVAIQRRVKALMDCGLNPLPFIERIEFKAHIAYALGNERVSCAMCILGSKNDLHNGRRHAPEVYNELVQIEDESSFTFRHGQSIRDLTV